MAKIQFELKDCRECPFHTYGGSSPYGDAYDLYCENSKKPRIIQEYIEYESEVPPVPDWCPIKIG